MALIPTKDDRIAIAMHVYVMRGVSVAMIEEKWGLFQPQEFTATEVVACVTSLLNKYGVLILEDPVLSYVVQGISYDLSIKELFFVLE